jgi:hypothetical protein
MWVLASNPLELTQSTKKGERNLYKPLKTLLSQIQLGIIVGSTNKHTLVNTGYNNPLDSLAIFLPSLPILLRATLLIPPAAMNEQGRHENSICPRQQVVKPTCCAHWVWQDEVAKIVDVSCKAPPSRAQKDTIMLYPITCSVLDSDKFSWRTPQLAVAVRATHDVFLVIDGSKQNVATDSSCQDCQR